MVFFQSRRSKACREKSAETIVPAEDSGREGSNLTEVNTTDTIKREEEWHKPNSRALKKYLYRHQA